MTSTPNCPLRAPRRAGPTIVVVFLALLIPIARAARAPARPAETVVAEIPDGRFIASDFFTGRPMIDFSDDFRQFAYVESDRPDAGEIGARVRVVLNGEAGPWYDEIHWYDSDLAANRAEEERYGGFLEDHFYYLASKTENPEREYLNLDGAEYGPYLSFDLLPTFDDKGRIIWVARPDHGVAALYTEGVLTDTTPERLRDTLSSRVIETADVTACGEWKPASGIARFDVFRIGAHCLYRVPTAPVEPLTWWLALDGEPISEDLEMIGKVVINGEEVRYGALDRDELIVVTVPLGRSLVFDDPPLELDFRIVAQAHETKNEALCGRITHAEIGKLCVDLFGPDP